MGVGVRESAQAREVEQRKGCNPVVALSVCVVEPANQFLCFRPTLTVVGTTEGLLPERAHPEPEACRRVVRPS